MRPTISKPATRKKAFGGALIGKPLMAKIQTDKAFRDQCLQAYANRLFKRTGKAVDVTYTGVHTDKRFVKLSFDGRESKSRYMAIPYKDIDSKGKPMVGVFKSLGVGQ